MDMERAERLLAYFEKRNTTNKCGESYMLSIDEMDTFEYIVGRVLQDMDNYIGILKVIRDNTVLTNKFRKIYAFMYMYPGIVVVERDSKLTRYFSNGTYSTFKEDIVCKQYLPKRKKQIEEEDYERRHNML